MRLCVELDFESDFGFWLVDIFSYYKTNQPIINFHVKYCSHSSEPQQEFRNLSTWCIYQISMSNFFSSWSCTLRMENLCIWSYLLDCWLRTTSTLVPYIQLSSIFDITEVLGSLNNPCVGWVDCTRLSFLRLCIGSLKNIYICWMDQEQQSTSLEGGRISSQVAHLEGKRILVVALWSRCWGFLRPSLFEVWSLKTASTRPWNTKSFNYSNKNQLKQNVDLFSMKRFRKKESRSGYVNNVCVAKCKLPALFSQVEIRQWGETRE